MAFASETRSTNEGLKLAVSAAVYALMNRISDYRAFRRTVAELSVLSTSELADLGLNHSTINTAAHEAVYGRRA